MTDLNRIRKLAEKTPRGNFTGRTVIKLLDKIDSLDTALVLTENSRNTNRRKFLELRKENEQLRQEFNKLSSECESCQLEYISREELTKTLNQRILELTNRNHELQVRNSTLAAENKIGVAPLSDWVEDLTTQVENLKSELKATASTNRSQCEQIVRLESELASWTNSDFERQLSDARAEIEELKATASTNRSQCEQIVRLESELSAANTEIARLNAENVAAEEHFEQMQEERDAFGHKLAAAQGEAQRLDAANDSLRHVIATTRDLLGCKFGQDVREVIVELQAQARARHR